MAKKPKALAPAPSVPLVPIWHTAGVPISDDVWNAIVEAVTPHNPDSAAREALNECLRKCADAEVCLDGLKIERAGWGIVVKSINDAASRMVRIRTDSRPLQWGNLDQGDLQALIWSDQDQQDLLALRQIQRRVEQKVEAVSAFLSAHQGQKNFARERLFRELFEVWEEHFGGKVRYSRNEGGEAVGPLPRLLTVVFERVLIVPVRGIANAIDRKVGRRR
jgi:hypothetical protein